MKILHGARLPRFNNKNGTLEGPQDVGIPYMPVAITVESQSKSHRLKARKVDIDGLQHACPTFASSRKPPI